MKHKTLSWIVALIVLVPFSFGLITHSGDIYYFYNTTNDYNQDLNISSNVTFGNITANFFCFGVDCITSWSSVINITKISQIENDVGLGFGTSNYTYNVTQLSDFENDVGFITNGVGATDLINNITANNNSFIQYVNDRFLVNDTWNLTKISQLEQDIGYGFGTSNYTWNISKYSDLFNDVGLGFGTSNYTYNVTQLSDFENDLDFESSTEVNFSILQNNNSVIVYIDQQDAAYDNDTLQSVTTRGNTTTWNITAQDFIIPSMRGNNHYSSLNDAFNLFNSAGRLTGGELIDSAGSTEVVVLAGEGVTRIADDDLSQVKFIEWSNSSPINITTDSIMYFGVDYNGGSPIVINTTTEADFDLDTSFPLGSCINQKGEIYCINNSWWVGDGLTNVIERFQADGYLYRDQNVGGLILGVTGTRNPTMTAGTIWGRLIEHSISAFDSSLGDTFDTYYRDGAGGYNEYPDQSQYNVTLWDDGSGTLQTIDNNKYVVLWVWVNVASQKISIIYPQAQYVSAAGAEAEEIPNTFPSMWYKGGIIIGRIITQKGSDTPVEVQSAFTTTFTAAQAADHANLDNLDYANSAHTGFMASSNNDSLLLYMNHRFLVNDPSNWT